MHYRNMMDLHIHSDNSKDAHHSVTLICEKAIEKGIRGIAVTDHCECLDYEALNYSVICRQSAFEAKKARAVFGGQLAVSCGVELGNPTRNMTAVADVMKYDFDFLIASVHRVKGKKKSIGRLDFSRDVNRPEIIIPKYFDELIEIAEWNGADALAHLTYPLRYFPPELLAGFRLDSCREQIRHILKTLAMNGKALEINTAGGEFTAADLTDSFYPGAGIVKEFKELGGEYITVGSDAHSAYDVGSRIPEAMEIAENAGFGYITYYEKHIPMPVKI